MNADDIGYLGANSDLVSYNLYAYCSNNPLNYLDSNGHFAISTLLISMTIWAVIGALVAFSTTAVQDYTDDGEIFNGSINAECYVGNSVGGFIAGAGMGACSMLGSAVGVAMATGEALSIGGMALSGTAALNLGMGTAFLTGGMGYTARTIIKKRNSKCRICFLKQAQMLLVEAYLL